LSPSARDHPAPGAILWDFDGTLAHRPGMWRGCLIEALDEHEAGHGVDAEDVRPFLQDGFPWHRPEVPHPELGEPEAWWHAVELVMARAYERVGIAPARAGELATRARELYIDPTRGWVVFEDTVPVLERLRAAGWRHVSLSNHVPELPALVDGLGLGSSIETVLTSASIGYEKPHPAAFELALGRCGGSDRVWMVGDNPVADVGGAEAVGIDAILVRRSAPGVARRADDLWGVLAIIEGGEAR
jgi:putative hydrolase of the HAD superfamily